jgi:hypothetical protein
LSLASGRYRSRFCNSALGNSPQSSLKLDVKAAFG